MNLSALIMVVGSNLMISTLDRAGKARRSTATQGPTAGELTQSTSNMLVSALVSTWLYCGLYWQWHSIHHRLSHIRQQAAIYNRWPLLIGQPVRYCIAQQEREMGITPSHLSSQVGELRGKNKYFTVNKNKMSPFTILVR